MVHFQSTHASLLARLTSGSDASAWSEFAAHYADLIRGFALRRGLQASDADDILQEVFLALTTAMKTFEYDPERGRFRGFLKTIAVRAIGKRLRRKSPALSQSTADELLGSASDNDELDWDSEWRQHHLRHALQRIRVEFRASDLRAFEMATRDTRDAKSIATELGLSVDSVYQAKSRILKRLKALVAEQIEIEG